MRPAVTFGSLRHFLYNCGDKSSWLDCITRTCQRRGSSDIESFPSNILIGSLPGRSCGDEPSGLGSGQSSEGSKSKKAEHAAKGSLSADYTQALKSREWWVQPITIKHHVRKPSFLLNSIRK